MVVILQSFKFKLSYSVLPSPSVTYQRGKRPASSFAHQDRPCCLLRSLNANQLFELHCQCRDWSSVRRHWRPTISLSIHITPEVLEMFNHAPLVTSLALGTTLDNLNAQADSSNQDRPQPRRRVESNPCLIERLPLTGMLYIHKYVY